MSRPTRRYPKYLSFRVRGYHPVSQCFPTPSTNTSISYSNRAVPISFATTFGISVDFFSSGYLDVSLPQVRLTYLCIQYAISDKSDRFPHSDIPGSKPDVGSPRLFADYHVLHRLLPPRHPPYALSHLTI